MWTREVFVSQWTSWALWLLGADKQRVIGPGMRRQGSAGFKHVLLNESPCDVWCHTVKATYWR
jgi:hypothetical protein